MATRIPTEGYLPHVHYSINEYLTFELNAPTIHAILSMVYYFLLEPTAAVSTIRSSIGSRLLKDNTTR